MTTLEKLNMFVFAQISTQNAFASEDPRRRKQRRMHTHAHTKKHRDRRRTQGKSVYVCVSAYRASASMSVSHNSAWLTHSIEAHTHTCRHVTFCRTSAHSEHTATHHVLSSHVCPLPCPSYTHISRYRSVRVGCPCPSCSGVCVWSVRDPSPQATLPHSAGAHPDVHQEGIENKIQNAHDEKKTGIYCVG